MRCDSLAMFAIAMIALVLPPLADADETVVATTSYGQVGKAIHARYEQHRIQRTLIKKSFIQAKQDLAWVQRDLDQLQQKQIEKELKYLESIMVRSALENEHPDLLSRTPTFDRTPREFSKNIASVIYAQEVSRTTNMELDIAINQTASTSANERKAAILAEFEKLQKLSQQWELNEVAIFTEYLTSSDICHTCSQTELQDFLDAIQEEEKQDEEIPNYGATLARMITLVRLGRSHETINQLDQLAKNEFIVGILARAIRADAVVQSGEPLRSLEKELLELNKRSDSDPVVTLLSAQVYANAGELDKAIKLWGKLKSNAKFEMMARRNTALAMACSDNLRNADKVKLLQEAKTASQLAAGTDWLSNVAYSIALYHSSHKAEALQYAKQASELAVAENKRFCAKLIKAIESDAAIRWDF